MKDSSAQAFGALIILGVIAYFHFSSPSAAADPAEAEDSTAAATQARVATADPPPASAVSCTTEEQCTAERLKDDADGTCRQEIRHRAKYDLRWDTSGKPLFQRAGWSDATKTAITYAGDAVSFQNGFGAFEHIVYLCTVDSSTGQLVKLELAAGQL